MALTALGTVKPVLAGCGILAKEIALLARKNGWQLDCDFLPASLHVDLRRLAKSLTACLTRNSDRDTFVFYGCCHPLMDEILESANTFRTTGQNCVEMLLGPERFQRELEHGAYFLLENWAQNWDAVATQTFGPNRDILRQIMHGDRSYVLALSTPCSGDFSKAATEAARQSGLPLRWMDVNLDHLEQVLAAAVARAGTRHARSFHETD